MGGSFYVWIMLAFFVGCGGVLLLLTGIFLIGHWLEKKQTGARHKFLELPHELRGETRVGPSAEMPDSNVEPPAAPQQ